MIKLNLESISERGLTDRNQISQPKILKRFKPELNFLIDCLFGKSQNLRKLAGISIPFFLKEFPDLINQLTQHTKQWFIVHKSKLIFSSISSKKQNQSICDQSGKQRYLVFKNVENPTVSTLESLTKSLSPIESYHHPYVFFSSMRNLEESIASCDKSSRSSFSLSMLRDLILLDTQNRLAFVPDPIESA
jgi:hypothetical protein